MLNVKNDCSKMEVSVSGDLTTICTDVAMLIRNIANGIGNKEVQEAFKAMFATGFASGNVYGCSREEMDNIMIDAYHLADKALGVKQD